MRGPTKGTIFDIVGGESGFTVLSDMLILDNWSSDPTIYKKKSSYPVGNVFLWLLKHKFIEVDEDDVLIRNYRQDTGKDVTIEDLLCDAKMYELVNTETGEERKVLRVIGWV